MQPPSADAVERVRAAVRGRLHGIDASHDLAHVERVERVGLRLATLEGADALLVQLACLLHDVDDWKYSGSDEAAAPAIRAILADAGFSQEAAARVVAVVQSVSFHAELGGAAAEDVESACVQDADRLDAIGAIGIARCFTYGGAKGRVLHDPAVPPAVGLSKAEYMASGREQTTINHFHEKLTQSGRAMAAERHAFMLAFLEQFGAEWDGVQ